MFSIRDNIRAVELTTGKAMIKDAIANGVDLMRIHPDELKKTLSILPKFQQASFHLAIEYYMWKGYGVNPYLALGLRKGETA